MGHLSRMRCCVQCTPMAKQREKRASQRECYLHVHFQLSGIKQGIKAHFNVLQNHRHELAQKYNYEYMLTHTHTTYDIYDVSLVNMRNKLKWCTDANGVMVLDGVPVCAADVHKTESN